MKEWHVIVLEGHKRIFDKIFFSVAEANRVHKEKLKEYAQEVKEGKYRVLREYY